ncbi:Peroxin-3 [Cunninghamella echinulata]|nr:Peroxin-3 [Cunninghamella echinulata]
MTILTSIKDYAKRHRRGLIVTATIAGGGYLAGKYATNKLREFQEKASSERLAKENLKRRFQQNQNDCIFTVLSLLPTLGDQILYEMNIEQSWAKLQESRKLEKLEEKRKQELKIAKEKKQQEKLKRKEERKQQFEDKTDVIAGEKQPLDMSVGSIGESIHTEGSVEYIVPKGLLDKKAKYLLWEDIKVTSFTRTLTSLYSVTLLTLLTHIQLNLLGRFTYVWSVSVLNVNTEPTIRLQHDDSNQNESGLLDAKTERLFLSTSWWLLHIGWRRCSERIAEIVKEVVGPLPLKSILQYETTEDIILQLRKKIEYEDDGVTPFNFRSWLLPETFEEELNFLRETGFSLDDLQQSQANGENKITIRQLLDETKDFLDSPDFITVLSGCLEEVYSIFDHNAFAKSLLPGEPIDSSIQRIQEISNDTPTNIKKKEITLANLLPSVSRQAHLIIAGNEYLNGFAYIKELQAFSAMVYTQYGNEVKA